MKFNLEKLLLDSEQANDSAVKLALQRAAEEEKKKQEDLILCNYKRLRTVVDSLVTEIRKTARSRKRGHWEASSAEQSRRSFQKW